MAQHSSMGSLDVELPVDIFDVQVNIPLIHQVVVAQQAAARHGTHSTKTRADVAGGGRKPYRQKGTGRARQGSIRAPQFVGGGVVHGPQPRSYDQRTPKKMKAAALRGALSDRARSGRIHVIESLIDGDKASTKTALAALRQLSERPRLLVVVDRQDTLTSMSLRNVAGVELLPFDQLNTYDVLKSDDVVFTKAAYDAFVGARSTGVAGTIKLSAAATEADAPAKAPAKKTAKPAAKNPPKAEAAPTAKPATIVDADAVEGATKTQPYGPGSKAPLKSGNAPKGFDILGNADSMKYHTTEIRWDEQTVAAVLDAAVEAAAHPGFTAPVGSAEQVGDK